MGLLNAFKKNIKREKVELKVEQKWEIIEYRKIQCIVSIYRKFKII